MSLFQEFKTFISRGNVVDLAVGVVVGTAFTSIVNTLVTNVIMPPIGYLTSGIDFSKQAITLSSVGLDGHVLKEPVEIKYGLFLNALISFLIISFVIFLVVKAINWIHKPQANTEPTAQEKLLMEIRDLLKNKAE